MNEGNTPKNLTTIVIYTDDLDRFNILKIQNKSKNQQDYFRTVVDKLEAEQKQKEPANPFPN